MNCLLKVENLCKSFLFEEKSVLVLKDISFEVSGQEFVSIIGSSGCGKSTLLELIAGITIPDSGKIYEQYIDITGRAGFAGYMPQDDLLLPWLTLLENAILPCRIKHKGIKQSRAKALTLLPDFGLSGYEHHLPWQLSGGMKQRAAFLRTVMSEADILLLDEPFANLDALTRLQMQQWLISVSAKLKQTIILVTHDIDEAIRLSDTIYVMDSVPAPFIHQEVISKVQRLEKSDLSNPLWTEMKAKLTAKLIK
jgi:ABC-type nitrate/sulfonate/bicarbonate transport system ATPase subunit